MAGIAIDVEKGRTTKVMAVSGSRSEAAIGVRLAEGAVNSETIREEVRDTFSTKVNAPPEMAGHLTASRETLIV